MRIGFEAKRIFFNSTGLGNYSRNLLRALANSFPGHEFLLFSPAKGNDHLFPEAIQPGPFRVIYPPKGLYRAIPSLWRTAGMMNALLQHNVQVFHGLSNELPSGFPRKEIPAVVTIHDLIFLRYPKHYAFIDRSIYRQKFRKACERADVVVAASEQTRQDIIQFFNTPAEKIKVVYQSVDPAFIHATDSSGLREKYKLPERFMLYVGSVTERKNLLTVLKAMQAAGKDLHLPLVIVGKGKNYFRQCEDFAAKADLNDRLLFLNRISQAELPGLYRLADFFIYPSLFEGFGIPVLEAMYSGTAVIAGSGSCLEEVGGDAAVYCDPLDMSSWAQALLKMQNEPEFRTAKAGLGKARAALFSPEQHALQMMGLYQSLAAHE